MRYVVIIVIATMTTTNTTTTIVAMSQESFRLRRLDISGLDLTLVPPHSLALALTKLEKVTMMIIYMHSHPNPTKVSVAESWLCLQPRLRQPLLLHPGRHHGVQPLPPLGHRLVQSQQELVKRS